MILGVGTDIIDVHRIEKAYRRYGERLLTRLLTDKENKEAEQFLLKKKHEKFYSYIAKRFTAKEACAKALGIGFGKDLSFQDVEISNKPSGQPIITLSAHGKKALERLAGKNNVAAIHLSLSDDYPFAIAFVVIG